MFSLFYKLETDICCVYAALSISESLVLWVMGQAILGQLTRKYHGLLI